MTIVMISVKYYTTTVLHNNIISYLWTQKICPRPRPRRFVLSLGLGLKKLSSFNITDGKSDWNWLSLLV